MTIHETYLQRCVQLARLGAGRVAPNPLVGAVLVHHNRIIGEGYHRQFGEAHAEVNCINSVASMDKALVNKSTLYVSLEPCAHFGKTPPCTNLIIANHIPHVVIGSRDNFEAVNGKGIEALQAAGIQVDVAVLEKDCLELNKRFFTFQEKKRPFIILKWAQSSNGKIAAVNSGRILISNEYTNRLVHHWRSEEASILVGTQTARLDNPALTTRLWTGGSPVRLVIDSRLSLPQNLKLFDGTVDTLVFNLEKEEQTGKLRFWKIKDEANMLQEILAALYSLQIQSVLVEGGAKLLQSFIDIGLWDEARVICNRDLIIASGLDAPVLKNERLYDIQLLKNDQITYFKHSAINY